MELSDILSLAERIKNAQTQSINEANTKASLVMPFLQAMGYDVFDHTEVAQEYTSEFGSKKGEKVDIAILRDGNPIMLIECKPLGDCLDISRCSQLFRYFNTQPARIGILTDGRRYLFFSDIEKPNVMDDKPFMEIDLLKFNERHLPELQKLTKEAWNIEDALSSAELLKYVRAVKILVTEDAQEPSDSLVRHYASQCFDGKLTRHVIDVFRPVVKRAITEHISDEISKRLESVRRAEEQITNAPVPAQGYTIPEEDRLPSEPQGGREGIVTHNTEVWALVAIRTLLRNTVDPARIVMRDQKSYCGILLDDNNRKPICRLFNFKHFDWGMDNIGENAGIYLFDNEEPKRVSLQYIDDIYPLAERLIAAVKKYE